MDKPEIKIISLNIERDKHLDKVIPFIEKEKPEVLCLQEIFHSTFEYLKNHFNLEGFFSERMVWDIEGKKISEGIAVFSRLPIQDHFIYSYTDHCDAPLDHTSQSEPPGGNDPRYVNEKSNHTLLGVEIVKDEKMFRVATTHFTCGYYGRTNKEGEFIWDIDSIITEKQKNDAENLVKILKTFPKIIFIGDLNAPRGHEVFSLFSNILKDNIPENYTTSIDGARHRAGYLPLMVDGLFTSDVYKTESVELVSGLSDHMAIKGVVSI